MIFAFQPRITRKQHKESLIIPQSLNPLTILPYNKSGIVFNVSLPVAYTFPAAIPSTLLQELYNDVKIISSTITNCKKKVEDSRGTVKTFILGHYLERGGTGNIHQSAFSKTELGQTILNKYKALWRIISEIARDVDTEFYTTLVHSIPDEYRMIGALSLFVCNLAPPKLVHKDVKDWKWCFVFIFGNVQQSGVLLYYMNTYVQMQVGDVLVLRSDMVWHQADQSIVEDVDRFSGVITTHGGLLKRFNKEVKK